MYPVLLIQFPQYLCRNPRHDAVIRHITVYDRSSRNDTVFPDGHSATDCCTRTDPASASDVDRLCILKIMETVRILLRQTLIGEERMESFFQQTLLSFLHPQRCAVEFITGFHPKRMVFFQIFAVGIVESAGFHSFPVIHVCFSFFGIAYLILLSPEMSAHFLL